MNILIAGASGLVGTELAHHLSHHHNITVLGRTLEKLKRMFTDKFNTLTWNDLEDHDATTYDLVINLSGASIGEKRWNNNVKKELIESRTITNKKLTEWLIHQHATPRFFCANAIGIYGAEELSKNSVDEDTPLPLSSHDFLQHIGLVWEQSLQTAINGGIPVTFLRFGVVLKQGGGMLKKLELPFRLGLGSVLGHGQQTLSWIYYQDLIQAIDFLIERPSVLGAINLTSPAPVTQQEFAEEFAGVINRKLWLKTPAFLIKILFGEMGEYLLLKGQRVIPKRLMALGFKFSYPTLKSALSEEFSKG